MRLPDGNPKVTLDDVFDWNEGLLVDAINTDRANKAAEAEARRKSKRGGARKR